MPDLVGVRAKLDRAKAHSEAFSVAFDAFLNSEPCGYTFKREDDPDWWTIRWIVEQPPPVELALVFGDMLTNTRAALDYLVWQLVLAAGSTPTEQTAFPAVKDAKKWPGAVGQRLRGVDPTWVAAIETLQPYHRHIRPELHPLALLDRVNNINKHRALPASLISVVASDFDITGDIGGRTLTTQFHLGPIEDGEIYIRMHVTPTAEHLDADPAGQLAVGISFADGVDYGAGDVPDFIGWVEDAITMFEPAFSS